MAADTRTDSRLPTLAAKALAWLEDRLWADPTKPGERTLRKPDRGEACKRLGEIYNVRWFDKGEPLSAGNVAKGFDCLCDAMAWDSDELQRLQTLRAADGVKAEQVFPRIASDVWSDPDRMARITDALRQMASPEAAATEGNWWDRYRAYNQRAVEAGPLSDRAERERKLAECHAEYEALIAEPDAPKAKVVSRITDATASMEVAITLSSRLGAIERRRWELWLERVKAGNIVPHPETDNDSLRVPAQYLLECYAAEIESKPAVAPSYRAVLPDEFIGHTYCNLSVPDKTQTNTTPNPNLTRPDIQTVAKLRDGRYALVTLSGQGQGYKSWSDYF